MRRLLDRRAVPLAAALLLLPSWAIAQPPPAGQPIAMNGGGTELFRGLLDFRGIKPVTLNELFTLRPDQWDDIIFIALGNQVAPPDGPRFKPNDYLQMAMGRGSVLIASDSYFSIGPGDPISLVLSGDRVFCDDVKSIHRNEPRCPYVVPIEYDGERPLLQLFKGLDRIATNSPTYLSVTGWSDQFQDPLARFPGNCRHGPKADSIPGDSYFATGAEGPTRWNPAAYRTVVMADHSIFINQMLLEPGTQNWELTIRTIDYLRGPESSPNQRKRCVFFENGRLVTHFDDLRQAYAKEHPMPFPQIDPARMQGLVADFLNRGLDYVEREDLLNRMLDRAIGLPRIARFFLIVGTVLASLYLLRRIWRSRTPSDIPPPPGIAGAPSGPPGVFNRRQKELLRRNNVFEPVRDLIREFFTSIEVHGDTMTRPPKLVIADVVRKPESLRMAIKDFWRIAFGPPEVLTVNRWRELQPFFDRVRQAHADGKWRFVKAESPVESVE